LLRRRADAPAESRSVIAFPPEHESRSRQQLRESRPGHEALEQFQNQSDSRRFRHLPSADNPELGNWFRRKINKVQGKAGGPGSGFADGTRRRRYGRFCCAGLRGGAAAGAEAGSILRAMLLATSLRSSRVCRLSSISLSDFCLKVSAISRSDFTFS